MIITNKSIMEEARKSLKGHWGNAIAVSIIYFAISAGISSIPKIGLIASLIISGPLTVGLYRFFLELIRGKEMELGMLFDGFSIFTTSLKAYLLMILYIILWSLLLIVPGIIAAISYSMTLFILADQNNIGASEAILKSKRMMLGNRMRFFLLGCRFIGWFILGILTAGIGFIWIGPYFVTSMSIFYEELKKNEQSAIVQTT